MDVMLIKTKKDVWFSPKMPNTIPIVQKDTDPKASMFENQIGTLISPLIFFPYKEDVKNSILIIKSKVKTKDKLNWNLINNLKPKSSNQ